MNTSLITFIFFVSALFFTFSVQARDIHFKYDASGNCIEKHKTVVLLRSTAPASAVDFDTDDFSLTDDVFGDIRTVIFPNPTRGILQVEFQNKDNDISVYYRLTDMNGRRLIEGTSFDSLLILDLSNMPTGIYLLHLTIAGKSETYKIIRQ